ncbi:HDOD domain-containing protein [Robbsia sp. KACC 23696]|uniref:HDOD domain-containing protein n=1 Tax=Robbsia sp. KACC 23696 TaxID=3149231 RepID=UPI00325A7F4F
MTDQKTHWFNRLFSEMETRGDLPSLQNASAEIADTLHREQANLSELTALVLSDLSLSQKIITQANAAMGHASGAEVTTVSRAIMALGVTAVERLSTGIRVLDQFETHAGTHAAARDALKTASIAGAFTRAFTHRHAALAGEEAVLASLLLQWAPAILAVYFEKDWLQVLARQRLHPEITLSDACHAVFGVSLTEVSAALAKRFSLPPELAESMEAALPPPGLHIGSHSRWLCVNATLAAEVASMIEKKREIVDIERFLLPYLGALGLDVGTMKQAVAQAVAVAKSFAEQGVGEQHAVPTQERAEFALPPHTLERLASALNEIRESAPTLGSATVLSWVVEAIGRCLNLQSAFLMIHQAKDDQFTAKVGYGDGMREVLPTLQFNGGFEPDLFHRATDTTMPMFFLDIQDDAVAPRIPEWHRSAFPHARSWIFVPVYLRDRCIALFCGTWGAAPLSRTLMGGEIEGLKALAAEMSLSVARSLPH